MMYNVIQINRRKWLACSFISVLLVITYNIDVYSLLDGIVREQV